MERRKQVVLVVEDDRLAQQMIRDMLATVSPPLQIESVQDGRAALDFLAKRQVDLICLDLMLPHLSGFEVCEEIRNGLGLSTPILITSIRALPEDRAFAEEMGVNGYLAKPLKAKVLIKEVRRLLRLDTQAVG